MSDVHKMTPADHLENSLVSFEWHAAELTEKFPQMTPSQQQAFIDICARIAGMQKREAA